MRGLVWLREWMSPETGRERRREELAEYLVHDLKAPLAAVLANAELIARATRSEPKIQAALSDIRASSDQMLKMILDLRDVGRSADGSLVPHKTSFEVGALLDEVRQRASARGIWNGNQVVLAPGSAVTLHADRELMRRVVDNLLDNSFRYAPTGGVITLAWEAREGDGGGAEVEIQVRDGGPGVPAELRERIFDRYAVPDRDRPEEGRASRGMGLVFCRAAVEAHGGRIWVEDNRPVGCIFAVRMPRGG